LGCQGQFGAGMSEDAKVFPYVQKIMVYFLVVEDKRNP